MSIRATFTLLFVTLFFAFASCSSLDEQGSFDSGTIGNELDASEAGDALYDVAPDTSVDSSTDAGVDASIDSPIEAAPDAQVLPPLQVIVSGAGQNPVQTLSVDQTTCSSLSDLAGKWAFYLSKSDGKGGSLPEQLISNLVFSRVVGHAEVLAAVETPVAGVADSYLGGAPYIALWQFNGCTITTMNAEFAPAFSGWHMAITDSKHLNLYGIGGSSARLEKVL